ncbi:MAG: fumarylacetoacetate hydrolase family protein [Nitrospira sp.]|nr:fumarylacetoacetate hydrolase family protein [Nitrospira sp.]
MKLVTFRSAAGPARVGALLPDAAVVDLQAAYAASASSGGRRASEAESNARERIPGDMIEFFAAGDPALEAAREAVAFAADSRTRGDNVLSREGHPIAFGDSETQLLAPVPRPTRIRDYLTYEAHGSASGLALPPAFSEMPICYKCNHLSVIGPEDEIVWPPYTDRLDYELEIGFYIGKAGRNIRVEEAPEYIAAVTIFNDVSARDIQLREMTLTIGPSKGKDFCTVMGPCAVTMDEIDEWNLVMRARVNGEVWSEGTSKNRRFSFAEVVAWASYSETIYPGEFLAVGTVGGGCGLELNRWIQPGDLVELEVEGIGTLRNRVGQRETVPAGAGLKSYPGPIWERG